MARKRKISNIAQKNGSKRIRGSGASKRTCESSSSNSSSSDSDGDYVPAQGKRGCFRGSQLQSTENAGSSGGNDIEAHSTLPINNARDITGILTTSRKRRLPQNATDCSMMGITHGKRGRGRPLSKMGKGRLVTSVTTEKKDGHQLNAEPSNGCAASRGARTSSRGGRNGGETRESCNLPNSGATEDISNINVQMLENDELIEVTDGHQLNAEPSNGCAASTPRGARTSSRGGRNGGGTRGSCTLPNSDATEDISNVNVRMLENDVLNAVEIGNEADFDDYVPPEALAANFQNDISVLDEMGSYAEHSNETTTTSSSGINSDDSADEDYFPSNTRGRRGGNRGRGSARPSGRMSFRARARIMSTRGRGRGHYYVPAYRTPADAPPHLMTETARKKFWTAVVKGTFLIAKGPMPFRASYYSIGRLGDKICVDCLALFYLDEIKVADRRKRACRMCCRFGKITVPNREIPPRFMDLFNPDSPKYKKFMDLIREYNSYFSAAAFQGKRVDFKKNYPWILKIHGQIQILLEPAKIVRPNGNPQTGMDAPSNFMFIDPAEAKRQKMPDYVEEKLDKDIIALLKDILQIHNRISQVFSFMGDVVNEQLKDMVDNGQEMPMYTVVFKSKDNEKDAEQGDKRVRWKRSRDDVHPGVLTDPLEANEIAAIFDSSGQPQCVPLYVRTSGKIYRVPPNCPFREALTYPLLYPCGESTWRPDLPHVGQNVTANRNKVTLREYYNYRQFRRRPLQLEHLVGKLAQQWWIDAYIRVEDKNLEYYRTHVNKLLASTRKKLEDFLRRNAEEMELDVGKVVNLPSSFTHSQANMMRLYNNCIETVRATGLPTFFITMTANPNWPELKDHDLINKGDPSLNADLVCRIFHQKLEYFLDLLVNKKVMGNVKNYIAVVEFQKRGLPHAHIILTVDQRLTDPDDVDSFITNNVPDPVNQPELHELVTTFMFHQECSERCINCVTGKCSKGYPMQFLENTRMDDGRGWVAIKRPEGGHTFKWKGKEYDIRRVVPYNPFLLKTMGCHLNVLPVCSLFQIAYLFKYVCKGLDQADVEFTVKQSGYVIKNPSRPTQFDLMKASLRVSRPQSTPDTNDQSFPSTNGTTSSPGTNVTNQQNHSADQPSESTCGEQPAQSSASKGTLFYDGIKTYQRCRYLTSYEACWRLFGFRLTYFMHKVLPLHVHLEGENPIYFKQGEEEAAINGPLKDSMLTAYFKLVTEVERDNRVRATEWEILQNVTYKDITKHYRWDSETRAWSRRKIDSTPVLGRLYNVSPKKGDLFYLRLLLTVVKGKRSFEAVRTVDGILHETYKEACIALGLASDDKEWITCLTEAQLESTPFALRLLFLTIILNCSVTRPNAIFESFWKDMARNWLTRGMSENAAKERLRRFLARKIKFAGGALDSELFNGVDTNELSDDVLLPEEGGEIPIPPDDEIQGEYHRLNDGQRVIVDEIVRAVMINRSVGMQNWTYLMEGLAGTGKTFVYKYLYNYLRSKGKKVICMAPTGNAACQLMEGRTCHSTLGLPVPINEESTSWFEPGTPGWRRLAEADFFICDEITMADRNVVRIFNSLMRRIRGAEGYGDPPFGGVPVLFGGDFRQLGPIPDKGRLMTEIHFRNSLEFTYCKILSLTQNMRALPAEAKFAHFLKLIGEGRQAVKRGYKLPKDSIIIPEEWVIKSGLLKDLIEWVYGDNPVETAINRVILTHLNKDCNVVNDAVLSKINAPEINLYSEDSVVDDDPQNPLVRRPGVDTVDVLSKNMITQDELHMATPSGFPPHVLNLKIGAIVMLIRNLDVQAGLVNGTRMQVSDISRNKIRAKVISGSPLICGQIVDLCRIDFTGKYSKAVEMRRLQFPIRLAFGVTVNKAQGLTIDKVGIYMPHHFTDHGKFYVAVSRVRKSSDIRMVIEATSKQGSFCPNSSDPTKKIWYTQNPVQHQIWNLHEPIAPPSAGNTLIAPEVHIFAQDILNMEVDIPNDAHGAEDDIVEELNCNNF